MHVLSEKDETIGRQAEQIIGLLARIRELEAQIDAFNKKRGRKPRPAESYEKLWKAWAEFLRVEKSRHDLDQKKLAAMFLRKNRPLIHELGLTIGLRRGRHGIQSLLNAAARGKRHNATSAAQKAAAQRLANLAALHALMGAGFDPFPGVRIRPTK